MAVGRAEVRERREVARRRIEASMMKVGDDIKSVAWVSDSE